MGRERGSERDRERQTERERERERERAEYQARPRAHGGRPHCRGLGHHGGGGKVPSVAHPQILQFAREREKLLAALCMMVQKMVEGNQERPSLASPDDFRDWGRRWGQDDDSAQLTLQCQWDNLLRHLMGITAAMEVWEPLTNTELGEVATTTEEGMGAPEVGGQEVSGHPQPGHEGALASTMTRGHGPTEDECFGEATSDHKHPGEHERPAEAE